LLDDVESPIVEIEDEVLEIPDPEVGQILRVNRRVASVGEAQALAENTLRLKNMRQLNGNIEFMGYPHMYSGVNVNVKGFGRFDTVVWNIEEVTHDISRNGYVSGVVMRGIVGY
jgi:hypothetical protein